jgi:hypothetical protein
VDGDLTWLAADDANGLLAYQRALGDETAIIVFNRSEDYHELTVEADDGRWEETFVSGAQAGRTAEVSGGRLATELAPLSAQVWIRN